MCIGPSRQGEEITRRVGELTAAGLPLAAGLRAMAEECSNRRVAKALRAVAERVEQRQPLETALTAPALPAHIGGLVRAAIRTGELGRVLADLAEQQQQARERQRMVVSALAYPLVLAALTLGIFIFFILVVVPPFREVITGFELEVPPLTRVLFWWSETGVWRLLAFLAATAIAVVVGPWIMGHARWRRMMGTIPLLGPIWQWSGAAELCRLLRPLLEQQVPLAEAIHLAADGVRDANVAEASRRLAAEIERGSSCSAWLADTGRLPACMTPLVAWGEKAAPVCPKAIQASWMGLCRQDEFPERTGFAGTNNTVVTIVTPKKDRTRQRLPSQAGVILPTTRPVVGSPQRWTPSSGIPRRQPPPRPRISRRGFCS